MRDAKRDKFPTACRACRFLRYFITQTCDLWAARKLPLGSLQGKKSPFQVIFGGFMREA
jgi:hypothetical protein